MGTLTSNTDIELTRPRCLIHSDLCQESIFDNLITPRDLSSWTTLKEAAQNRMFAPLLSIADRHTDDESVPPGVYYHRKCRQLFTVRVPMSPGATAMPETPSCKQRRIVPGTKLRVLDDRCIFCQKVKYMPKSNTREQLVQCREMRADERIRNYAKMTQDDHLLRITECYELVAAEAKYHQSCYRKCKHVTDEQAGKTSAEVLDDCDANIEAYDCVVDYIEGEVFCAKQVVALANIAKLYVDRLLHYGLCEVSDSTKRNLRRKLERTFENRLHFCQAPNGRVLLWSDNLSMEELVVENYTLRQESLANRCSETDRDTVQTAKKIRHEIKQMKSPYNFPYVPHVSIATHAADIPGSLQVLLSNIIATSPDRITSQQQQRMNSIAADLIYSTTSGRIKMPKHILLPFGIKSLTGNVEIIHMLNRLGHGIAYSQLLEIETAIAMQQQQSAATVPTNAIPHVFTTLAWDNIDNCEETLSGEGTSHRVNGIAIQHTVQGPQPCNAMQCVARTRQRSFPAVDLPLPRYTVVQRVGPGKCPATDIAHDTSQDASLRSNLLWAVCRHLAAEKQSVPSWTGFNICTRSDENVTADNIVYLPPIDGPASSMSTVWELLNRSVEIQKKLCLPSIVCVFDQALYAKAAEVVWAHRDNFDTVVLCLGVFHTICTLLRIIGTRFADAGLRDLLVETGIVAAGSVSAVLEGRQYNRGMRAHKLVYEALLRMVWKHFRDHVQAFSNDADRILIAEALYHVGQLHADLCESQLHSILELESVQFMMSQFEGFLKFLRQSNGDLSAFWMSYVDIVNLMLDLVRASREGNWSLHMASIRSLIPWCFAYDRSNYARYLPVYLSHMCSLQQLHPEVKTEFESGSFSVQLSDYNTFGRIPIDQTIEETINKDTKIAGGTKGFSRNVGAVNRHFLAAGMTSNCLKQLRILTKIVQHGQSHADLTFSRIQHDERDVQKVLELLTASWIDPFAEDRTDLVSLSSGKTAPTMVADNLLRALEYGEAAYQKFSTERLNDDGLSDKPKFHDPLPRLKLHTFVNAVQSKVVKSRDRAIVMKSDKNLFGKMILIGQTRKLQMSEVLCHPLGPIPYELANPDGSIRKNNKSSLGKEILKKAALSTLTVSQEPSAYIVDGMAMVHRLPPNLATFGDAADALQRMLVRDSGNCSRVDIVFDVYRDTSIKGGERERRGHVAVTKFANIQAGHKIQQWKKFLAASENKMQFITFVSARWMEDGNRQKLGNKTVYITDGNLCRRITNSGVEAVHELSSSHEEADTRLLLHVNHASSHGMHDVVVAADDTDVLILLLACCPTVTSEVYLKSTVKNQQFYNIV